jgi:carboxypeptidase PM20D1
MKKILLSVAILVVVLVAILFYRATSVFENNQYLVKEPLTPITLDKDAVIDRFSRALQIPTISYDDKGKLDHASFQAFHQHLAQSFP